MRSSISFTLRDADRQPEGCCGECGSCGNIRPRHSGPFNEPEAILRLFRR